MIAALAELYGAKLTAEIDDGTQRIVALTLDASSATRAVRVLYPVDGSKVNVLVPAGQIVTRTFVGSNRLERITAAFTKPDGAQIVLWSSPTWRMDSGL